MLEIKFLGIRWKLARKSSWFLQGHYKYYKITWGSFKWDENFRSNFSKANIWKNVNIGGFKSSIGNEVNKMEIKDYRRSKTDGSDSVKNLIL